MHFDRIELGKNLPKEIVLMGDMPIASMIEVSLEKYCLERRSESLENRRLGLQDIISRIFPDKITGLNEEILHDIIDSWLTGTKNDTWINNVWRGVGKMYQLEDQIGLGTVLALYQTQGITNFGRYKMTEYEEQIENIGTMNSCGCWLGAWGDHNGAMLTTTKNGVRDDFNRGAKTFNLGMKIIESKNIESLKARLETLTGLKGGDKTIKYLVVNAHGRNGDFDLSVGSGGTVSSVQLLEVFLKVDKDICQRNMPIAFLSCEGGFDIFSGNDVSMFGSLAQHASMDFNGYTWGPDVISYGCNLLKLNKDASGQLFFTGKHSDGKNGNVFKNGYRQEQLENE